MGIHLFSFSFSFSFVPNWALNDTDEGVQGCLIFCMTVYLFLCWLGRARHLLVTGNWEWKSFSQRKLSDFLVITIRTDEKMETNLVNAAGKWWIPQSQRTVCSLVVCHFTIFTNWRMLLHHRWFSHVFLAPPKYPVTFMISCKDHCLLSVNLLIKSNGFNLWESNFTLSAV